MVNKFISIFSVLLTLILLIMGCTSCANKNKTETVEPDVTPKVPNEQVATNSVEETPPVEETPEATTPVEVEPVETSLIEMTPNIVPETENVVESIEPTAEPTVEPTKPVENEDKENEDKEETKTEIENEVITYFSEADVVALAKVLYNECRGIPSDAEKACVGWVACNRVDAGYANTIYEVLTAPYQFAYDENTPVTDELYNLSLDVLTRWNSEKNGIKNVGRVLPSNYLWFHGDGVHNWFRNAFSGNFDIWNYTLSNPYED